MFPDGSGAAWSPLKRDGRLKVSETRIPNASNSKIDGFEVSTSRSEAKSLRPWLRTTLGSPKFEPTTPQKRTRAERHWCWREDIVAMSTIDFLPPSRPESNLKMKFVNKTLKTKHENLSKLKSKFPNLENQANCCLLKFKVVKSLYFIFTSVKSFVKCYLARRKREWWRRKSAKRPKEFAHRSNLKKKNQNFEWM